MHTMHVHVRSYLKLEKQSTRFSYTCVRVNTSQGTDCFFLRNALDAFTI